MTMLNGRGQRLCLEIPSIVKGKKGSLNRGSHSVDLFMSIPFVESHSIAELFVLGKADRSFLYSVTCFANVYKARSVTGQ